MSDRPSTFNAFRHRLRSGERLLGLWASLCSNLATELLAGVGFDWMLIDGEHAPNDLSAFVSQLQAVKGTRTAPVVRPQWNDPVAMKRLLDIGVANFLIPFVESAEQAEAAVRATRYPPRGIRGVASAHRGNAFGAATDYFGTIDDHITVLVQVESRPGLDAVDAICRVPDVDGVFFGPSDLAASLGHLGDPAHESVQAAIAAGLATCRARGKPAGILTVSPSDARRYLAMGFSFVAVGSDIALLRKGAASLLAEFPP